MDGTTWAIVKLPLMDLIRRCFTEAEEHALQIVFECFNMLVLFMTLRTLLLAILIFYAEALFLFSYKDNF